MPNYTENLQLAKPLQSEQYNVDVFNANADKIDQFAGQTPARALTADKLTTGAKINGINFKGDADVVTGAGFYYDTVTYGAGDLAFIYNQDSALELHKSLVAGNIGHNPLTSTGYWEKVELGGGATRNIGEIVASSLPLTDAGLHLLDGTRLSGEGIYSAFVDYIAGLYDSSAKTSNVTKIGSLTDNNGVLSGFSASNYARTSNFKPVSNSWEIATKFNISAIGTVQALYGGGGVNQRLLLGINANGQPYVSLSHSIGGGSFDIGAITLDTILNLNVDYWIKCQFTGTAYILSLSTDGISYDITETLQSTTTIYDGDYPLSIGANQYSSSVNIPLNGSIDLKESYININGQRWWTGANPSWATDESDWQSSVSTYGVCGKFVYDSVNNTVRLPKYNSKIYTGGGTAPVVGNGTIPQLTSNNSHTGELVISSAWTGDDNGRYLTIAPYNSNVNGSKVKWSTNASTSGLIADLSDITASLDGYYYIVIATTTKTEIEVDIDEIATDLNGKADTDLSNCTKPHIVETYVNGTSWYRVYSDGWCEQGGIYTSSVGNNVKITVNLLKQYMNTNYNICITLNRSSDGGSGIPVIYGNPTTTTFVYMNDGDYDELGFRWQTCGYIS